MAVKTQEKNWLQNFQLKRNIMRANSFLMEAIDDKRLDTLSEVLKTQKSAKQLFPAINLTTVYKWDIQRNILTSWDIKEMTEWADEEAKRNKKTEKQKKQPIRIVEVDPMKSRLEQINDFFAREESIIVIIYYVFTRGHAEMLQDYLVGWARDENMDIQRSSVAVFTADAGLFNENARRICEEIEIPASTADERRILLQRVAKELTTELGEKTLKEAGVNFNVSDEIVNASSGLDLATTSATALQGFYETRKGFSVQAFTTQKISILNTFDIEYFTPKQGYNTIGGISSFKKFMQRSIILPFKYPKIAEKFGLPSPRGIIAIGPPGTGKTVLGKATAYELGLPMASMNTAALLRGVVGESESRTRQVLRVIQSLSPIVVLWDELDEIAKPREKRVATDSGVFDRTVNAILSALADRDRQYFVFGTTNIFDLDAAFQRPGRFDFLVPVWYPNLEGRKEILNIHTRILRNIPIDAKEADSIFSAVASKTFTFSGADLEKVCTDAAINAMSRSIKTLDISDFEKALRDMETTVNIDDFESALKDMDINQRIRTEETLKMAEKLKIMPTVHKGFLKESLAEFLKGEEHDNTSRFKGILEGITDIQSI